MGAAGGKSPPRWSEALPEHTLPLLSVPWPGSVCCPKRNCLRAAGLAEASLSMLCSYPILDKYPLVSLRCRPPSVLPPTPCSWWLWDQLEPPGLPSATSLIRRPFQPPALPFGSRCPRSTLDANRHLGASCLEGAALYPSEACLCGDARGRLTVAGCWCVKPSPQASWEL